MFRSLPFCVALLCWPSFSEETPILLLTFSLIGKSSYIVNLWLKQKIAPQVTSCACAYACTTAVSISCDCTLHLLFFFFLFFFCNLLSLIWSVHSHFAGKIICRQYHLSFCLTYVLLHLMSLNYLLIDYYWFWLSNFLYLFLDLFCHFLFACSKWCLSCIGFLFISLCSLGKPIRFVSLI